MKKRPYTALDFIVMAALALLAFAAAAWMATHVTRRMPHLEDEMTYLFQARIFARGALWAPPPPDTRSFFVPFALVINGHWIGKYTVGWPLVLALGETADAGWLVNPALGGLTVAVTYCLGRDVYGRQVGLLAGLLALASPFFLIQAGTLMSHTAGGLWAALLLWAWRRIELAREAGGRGRGWAVLGGAALGMLTLTRPLTGAAVGLPFAAILSVRLFREPRRLAELARTYWPLALTALLFLLVQPLWLWLSTGHPTTNLYTLVWPYDRVGFGAEIGRHGHTLRQGLRTARADLRLWSGDLFGWYPVSWLPLALGLLLGSITPPPHRRYWAALLVAPFAALVVVHLAYWIGASVYGPRYYYEAHAGLAVLAALGLREGVRLMMRLPGGAGGSERWSGLLPAGTWPVYPLLAVLIGVSVLGYLPQRLPYWQELYGITPEPVEALREAAGEEDVLVFVRGWRWRDYAPFFADVSPWLDGPIVAAHDVTPAVNEAIIARFPGRSVWYYADGVLSPDPLPYTPSQER